MSVSSFHRIEEDGAQSIYDSVTTFRNKNKFTHSSSLNIFASHCTHYPTTSNDYKYSSFMDMDPSYYGNMPDNVMVNGKLDNIKLVLVLYFMECSCRWWRCWYRTCHCSWFAQCIVFPPSCYPQLVADPASRCGGFIIHVSPDPDKCGHPFRIPTQLNLDNLSHSRSGMV